MATTTKITDVVKIAEFPELADALLDSVTNNNDRRFLICNLIDKQTVAKQKKFWKFYDAFVAEKVGA